MIEIYLLEALAAFYQYGTLSAASEHLHISQPALSRSMQKLEDLMGVSLFERTKNRITLNETGKLAAMHAERILQSEEEMIRIVRNYDSSLHTISVGYCAPGPMMEMPAMLSSLYPGMAVSSEIEEEEKLLKGVRSRKYTMAVLSYPVQDENLVCRKCGSEQLFISLIPAHSCSDLIGCQCGQNHMTAVHHQYRLRLSAKRSIDQLSSLSNILNDTFNGR